MRTLPVLVVALVSSPALAADGRELFEKKIRPVLVEHCYSCHSGEAEAKKKLKAGLRLDSKPAVLAGGDSGPALVPHKPADSLLLDTLKYDGDVRMPPKGKLPDSVVADFEAWIKAGAPGLPEAGGVKKQIGMSVEEGRKFWAFRPVAGDPKGSIDTFVSAALTAKGLTAAPPADRRTLARRVYFDLVGLPPSPEEVEAFANDQSPDAFEKLVDKLLASPAFGERWGRHWLDVARYAESVTLRGFVFPNAWRYRDYVIDSLNRDVPFDRFIREQIAGDLLPADSADARARQLVATSLLAMGNNNLEEQDKKQLRMDVVDEQLDVITKGFLAQTVTCARCHDHKFDPIPTKDYYALAGILRNAKALETANVSQWIEVPLPVPADREKEFKEHEAKVSALQARIKVAKGMKGAGTLGILPVAQVPGVVVDDAQAKKVGDWMHSTHSGIYIGAGYVHDKAAGKGEKTLTFQPDALPPGRYEVRLAYSPGEGRAGNVPVTVFSAAGETDVTVDMKKNPPIDARFVSLGEFRFEKAGAAYLIISNEGTTGHVTADAVVFVPLDAETPATTATAAVKPTTDTVKALEAELKKLQASGPKRPATMSVTEEKQIEDIRVHVRGSVHNLGEPAPRGFLQVAAFGPAVSIPKGQSGRKELADWIAANENPLTARVFANRAWHWLFGAGIVRTPDNFGVTGEKPSHPELLDHLATAFVADGWSVKKLVRRIVLSQTYRRSAAGDAKLLAADPENQLFGRANRRRLDAECIRDAMLAVSGSLDRTVGGKTFPDALAADYGHKAVSDRRSVYLPQFRNALPEPLDVFDAADPSTVTGKRNTSTVAQQALYFLNHPFPREQAERAAKRLPAGDAAAKLSAAYRLALGREPTPGERDKALAFVAARGDGAWAGVLHALFASPDFRFVE